MSCPTTSTSMVLSFIAGIAVGVGAVLLIERGMKESLENEYETDQLFV